jgi:hypothetical protein
LWSTVVIQERSVEPLGAVNACAGEAAVAI